MAFNLISADLDQQFLLPPDMRAWLPAGHLAWFVIDAVAAFDPAPFLARHRSDGRGGAAYDPMVLVAVLVYAYCVGERSSRRIEQLLSQDIAFRVVGRNLSPDHATIARFRAAHDQALAGLFGEMLELCARAGLVEGGLVAIDGTKLQAAASMSANGDESRLRRALEDEARRVLAEAAEVDAAEDALYGEARGDELPAEFADPSTRAARIRAALERLRAERDVGAAEAEALAAAREAKGHRKPGRKPKPDRRSDPPPRANMTDPDSRIMPTAGGWVQGYNAQAAVDENQIIVAAELTQQINDAMQFVPLLNAALGNLDAAGVEQPIKVVVADAGYWSAANVTCELGPEILIAPDKRHRVAKLPDAILPEPEPPLSNPTQADRIRDVEAVLRGEVTQVEVARRHGVVPHAVNRWVQNARTRGPEAIPAVMPSRPPSQPVRKPSLQDEMRRRLASPIGQALYRRRSQLVEPVFGQIKDPRRIRRFQRRGLTACSAEWKLIAATHNLLKLWRHQLATPT